MLYYSYIIILQWDFLTPGGGLFRCPEHLREGSSLGGAGSGFQLLMGVRQVRWMVFVRENPIYRWMMIWVTPILGNHHNHPEVKYQLSLNHVVIRVSNHVISVQLYNTDIGLLRTEINGTLQGIQDWI